MNLTESAENQIVKLVTETDDVIALRVGIVGGGCSGFNYTFSFADKIEDYDTVIDINNEASVLVDTMSLNYLSTATIDYTSDIQGERFVINNPEAKTTCGCGSSFSV